MRLKAPYACSRHCQKIERWSITSRLDGIEIQGVPKKVPHETAISELPLTIYSKCTKAFQKHLWPLSVIRMCTPMHVH